MGKYVCLSYRWGPLGSALPLLTKKNKSEFEQEIPWLSMPKTFKDVFILVRRLGIEFLWVDSLCILQDDLRDWYFEAAVIMSDIYQKSWLTIAATGSKDSNNGLYSVLGSFHVPKELSKSIFIRQSLDHPFQSHSYSLKEFLLLSRGWVYQERLLPPIVVHFTQQELVFECREGFWCGCGIYKSHGEKAATLKFFYS